MRKACMAGISVLIGISMLAGCGKSLDADTDTVYVQKNGTVLSVDELDNERIDLDFCWVPLEDLKKGTKVYPLELIPYILEQGKEIIT